MIKQYHLTTTKSCMGIYTSCHFQIRFSNNTHTIHLLRRVNTFACQRPFNNRETTGYNTFWHSLSPHKTNTLLPNRSQGFPRLPAAKRNHESPALRKSLPSHPQLHQHLSLSPTRKRHYINTASAAGATPTLDRTLSLPSTTCVCEGQGETDTRQTDTA